jgi:dihydroxyacetone kinase-like protein
MTSVSILNRRDFQNILALLNNTFEEQKTYLCSLDAEIGDGDHGFSMSRGFNALAANLDMYSTLSIGSLLKKAGFELINSIGGAAGAIFGTLFLGQAAYYESHLVGKEELELQDLSGMWSEALARIKARGDAQPGEKTMIDALEPAAAALSQASAQSLPLALAFQNACQAAWQGAQSTREMQGKRGRAKFLAERSIGHLDPGAMSTYFILKTISDYIDLQAGKGH